MYFNFSCSECGKNLKVREENAGRRARCPYCHATLVVPQRATSGGTQTPQIDTGPVVSSLPSRRKPKRETSVPSSQAAVTDGTNVSMLWTALVGLGMTVAFLILLLPFSGTYLRALFYERSWVTPTEAFLMFWSIAVLIFKWRNLKRQRESMLFDALPESLSPEITLATLDKFVAHARELPVEPRESFLVQRVLRGLEHFRVRKSASETATMLASQSEIDGAAVESSYALLNVFIWAIPILGFIGTVQGLGGAVGELSGSLEGAESVEDIKGALQGVTTGLGTAFDTTLIALIMALVLKFPASSLQKAEEDLLNSVDEYCNENLLRRLNDGGAVSGDGSAQAANASQLIEAVGQQMKELVHQHRAATRELSAQTGAVQKQISESVHASTESQQRAYVETLERSVAALNGTLAQLGKKQLVVEMHEAPRRRWSWFGRKDEE